MRFRPKYGPYYTMTTTGSTVGLAAYLSNPGNVPGGSESGKNLSKEYDSPDVKIYKQSDGNCKQALIHTEENPDLFLAWVREIFYVPAGSPERIENPGLFNQNSPKGTIRHYAT